jgi:hypothetical protein
LQRVVIPLLMGPGILPAGRSRQRIQDRGDDSGALGGQVAGHDPGAFEGGLHGDGPVVEPVTGVVVGRGGPGVDLRGQLGRVPLVGAGPGGRDQDLIRGGPAVPGQPE